MEFGVTWNVIYAFIPLIVNLNVLPFSKPQLLMLLQMVLMEHLYTFIKQQNNEINEF